MIEIQMCPDTKALIYRVVLNNSFQVLDQDKIMWVARMQTTHNHRMDMPEMTFNVLVRATDHFVIEDKGIESLIQWYQELP